jgi:MFS transporter, DHA2 family, multidrug resistance protein
MSTQSLTDKSGFGVPALKGPLLWSAGILLAAANFLAVLDVTIANVSVANISGSLGVSSSQGLWVITSYAVAEAITVPLTGWLAGRFGAVRVFIAAMFGFGLFSALCGLSPSLEVLVLFRVFQGFAGGPLLPLSQTLLLHIFPKTQQPTALALWAVTTLVAPILGPILGGVLCDNLGWPSIFLVNVPVAFMAAPVLAWLLASSETPTTKKRVDGIGLALLIVWVGALQIMLDLGKEHDWFESGTIVALAAVALAGFAAFLIWELTDAEPIVPLKVFRHRGFATAMVTLSLAFGAFFASNVITPLWLQSNMGYTATWAGYVTGTLGITAVFAAPIAAKLAVKIDPRKIVFVGILWLAFAIFMRSFSASDMTYWQITTWVFLAGAGMPLFFLPLTGAALASVDPEETAGAAGLMSFIRTLSGAFATSIANTVWENGAIYNQAELAGTLNGARATLDAFMQGGMSHDQALTALTQMVQGQSMMLATNQTFMGCAIVFLIAAATIWLVPKPTRVADTSLGH